MIAPRVFFFGLAALVFFALADPGMAAEDALAKADAEIQSVQHDLIGKEADFDALLELRGRIDPLRDDLHDAVTAASKKLDEAKTKLAGMGAEPVPPAPPETAEIAAKRKALQSDFAAADAGYKKAKVTQAEAETLWAHLSDLRRAAFDHQIFKRSLTPLAPVFWERFVTHGIPAAAVRTGRTYQSEVEWVEHEGAGFSLAVLAGTFLGLAIVFFAMRLWLRRRAARNDAGVSAGAPYDRGVAVRHGFLALLQIAVPFPLIFALFDYSIQYFDLASDNIDLLLERCTAAVIVVGAARGIMTALLSPGQPQFRLIDCSELTAKTVHDGTIWATNLFVIGILLTAYEDIVDAPASDVVVTSLLVAGGIGVALAHALFVLRDTPAYAEDDDENEAPAAHPAAEAPLSFDFGWVRPILLMALLGDAAAIAFGYISLAGFLMTRLAVLVLVISLAILLGLLIEELFSTQLSSQNRKGRAFARAVGLAPSTLDLASTTIAGLLRLAVVSAALIFAFAPWGFKFGDINPFNDDVFAFSFNYLRFSIGTAAFSLLTFSLGLLGTRLITGWLDRRLLPLTALDPGVRNSMTTVLGYIGFAVATVIALAQLGVNPQNLTVVAGALSVGIGFGLQAITANFISGLIVLAERPIRVGDTVTVKGEQGKVKKISVRSTTIAGVGTDIIVPNTDILTSVVTNKSLSDWLPRLKVAFALAQDADQDKAAGIMLDCARANPNVLDDPEPLALFLKAGERGLEFELRCAIDDADPDHADAVRSALNFAIIRDFRQHGITLAGAWPAEPGAPAKMAPARPRVATPVV